MMRRTGARLRHVAHATAGALTALVLKVMRLFERRRSAAIAARVLRRVGPWLPEHRVARDNLVAAFPEKSAEEIDRILSLAWDNLGRVAGEFAHIDRFRVNDPDRPGPFDIDYDTASRDRFYRLRDSGRPALVFAAHLGNWELPARVAAAHGVDAAILYRPPGIPGAAEAIATLRAKSMGTLVPTGPDAPFRLATLLERGATVAMLVDQHSSRGVEVTFFGRRCFANPTLARLARHFDCPIHGTRIIRLPGDRFRAELTEAITPVRRPDGQIDVEGTMQAITAVIEGWVREHPEQWLWMHRRWRR